MLEASYCKGCGKEFYPTPEHIYRDSNGSYCCWTCFNHRNDKKVHKYKQYKVEMYDLNGLLLKTFLSTKDAADHCKGLPAGIRKACNEKTKYKGYLWRYQHDMS